MPRTGIPSRLKRGVRKRVWSMHHQRARVVGCSQHGGSLTDTRTEKVSAIEVSVLQLASRVVETSMRRGCSYGPFPVTGGLWSRPTVL